MRTLPVLPAWVLLLGLFAAGCGGGETCRDLDGDGYGEGSACLPDCDDSDPGVHPGAAEVCGDGIDNDCDGETDDFCPCDCPASCAFTRQEDHVVTRLDDAESGREGVQLAVRARTDCIPGGTTLSLSNKSRPGGDVSKQVVIDDPIAQTGQVDFGAITLAEGVNHLCIAGEAVVNRMADGNEVCDPQAADVQICADMELDSGRPDCRFEEPTDGSVFGAAGDSSPLQGFQHDVRVACQGVLDGEPVSLMRNGGLPQERILQDAAVTWEDVSFAEGFNTLELSTIASDGSKLSEAIQVTIDTGGCAVRIRPPDGTRFRLSDDEDATTAGLQATIRVETDADGPFACAEGSSVALHVDDSTSSGVITSGAYAESWTIPEGRTLAFAEVQEPGGRSGRSLDHGYLYCSLPPEILITTPSEGAAVEDADDLDAVAAGIQVSVGGTCRGVETPTDLRLLVDGVVVRDGAEPLEPSTFAPGGPFEFRYATFLQNGPHVIQVLGVNLCGVQGASLPVGVDVSTGRPTCQITDPPDGSTLLAADDKDGDAGNDLQYDVVVVTENVAPGTAVLEVNGQVAADVDPSGVTEMTFADGVKTLRCIPEGGDASPVVTVTVDGHPPSVRIVSPSDGAFFNVRDIVVELVTQGAEDGTVAQVEVVAGTDQGVYTCAVQGNAASCSVMLFSRGIIPTRNTLTAGVSDQAGNPAEPDRIEVTASF